MPDYKALVVREAENNFETQIETLPLSQLDDDAIRVKVNYSSLNYKDALSASGNKGVTREYPHTPGIDAVGKVVESNSDTITVGESVIVTGYDLGMNTNGGLAEYIDVPASWAVQKPKDLSDRQCMLIGTAGLTAAIGVEKLLQMQVGNALPIAVTGASGGVGCCAVALLASLGFNVTAISGKPDIANALLAAGASTVIGREALEASKRPIEKPAFSGAIDTVGGDSLVSLLKKCAHSGSVACCGLAQSPALSGLSVFPFILRGVNLLGIDSVEIPIQHKQALWRKLANDWHFTLPDSLVSDIELEQVPEQLPRFLDGSITGRLVVKIT
ncbi:YhdH/YhfP family quinone oxidoreductase [bacterium]|nr:YhdH/YhfP family quinone oxidoreductase [bacterium]